MTPLTVDKKGRDIILDVDYVKAWDTVSGEATNALVTRKQFNKYVDSRQRDEGRRDFEEIEVYVWNILQENGITQDWALDSVKDPSGESQDARMDERAHETCE